MTGPDEKLAATLERIAADLTKAARYARLDCLVGSDLGQAASELLALATADAVSPTSVASSVAMADETARLGGRSRSEALRALMGTHADMLARALADDGRGVVTNIGIIRGYAAALAVAESGVEVQS